ncbi:hypothetical protein H4Q26_014547 [Puccinia striiformis f. sp. tritici PST-130]|nr:hypothetical protein H4Q26_013200 [Puccinia striiformis f. sp. tritici PST-130]KAI9623380.1 hypothetical protein H4Q26_014547 [Puccinia striiformis f. sp. tritici PST-130]
MLDEDPHRALYGELHVDRAAGRAAIDPETRKKFTKLTESVQPFGGEVLVFLSMHSTGTS